MDRRANMVALSDALSKLAITSRNGVVMMEQEMPVAISVIPSLGCPHWVSGIAFPRPNAGHGAGPAQGFQAPLLPALRPGCSRRERKGRVGPFDARSFL